eukprot:6298087-Prorocentrum_lima.AAC.1
MHGTRVGEAPHPGPPRPASDAHGGDTKRRRMGSAEGLSPQDQRARANDLARLVLESQTFIAAEDIVEVLAQWESLPN